MKINHDDPQLAPFRDVPQKLYRMMSGRQAKQLNEQADRYGIPFGGAKIDLCAVILKFHEFLSANSQKLASARAPDPVMQKQRETKIRLMEIEIQEKENRLVPRHEVRQHLTRIAAILRRAGDRLQRQFGPEAVDVLNEALDDARAEIGRSFGEGEPEAG